MNPTPANGHSASDEVRAWYRQIGRGWKTWTKEQRSAVAKLTGQQRWETRRLRYGKSGMREKPYAQWLRSHGKPSPSEKTDESSK